MEPRHECPTSDGPHRHNTQYSVEHTETKTSGTQGGKQNTHDGRRNA